MCLSDSAIRERTWGPFPALRQFLEDKSLSWEYYGASSASDNVFEVLPRVLKIGFLTRDNREGICSNAANISWDALHRDVETLAHELDGLAQLLRRTAEEVRGLHSMDREPQGRQQLRSDAGYIQMEPTRRLSRAVMSLRHAAHLAR